MNSYECLQDKNTALKILRFLYRVVPVQVRPGAPNFKNQTSKKDVKTAPDMGLLVSVSLLNSHFFAYFIARSVTYLSPAKYKTIGSGEAILKQIAAVFYRTSKPGIRARYNSSISQIFIT